MRQLALVMRSKKLQATTSTLKPSEKEIERSILQYLEFIPDCYAWKNQSTGVYDPTKQLFRKARSKYSINGVSDILGIFKGRFLAIEVKTPQNKKRTEDQNSFINQVNKRGGLAFYATSIEDVKAALEMKTEKVLSEN